MTPAEALKLAEKNGAKMVDFKFIDLLGIWQHTTMPIAQARSGIVQGRLRLRRLARSAAGSRSTRPTCSSSRIRTRRSSIRS